MIFILINLHDFRTEDMISLQISISLILQILITSFILNSLSLSRSQNIFKEHYGIELFHPPKCPNVGTF